VAAAPAADARSRSRTSSRGVVSSSRMIPKSALTIAGSDSGGGAGIQADLKTFAALGVYGFSVVTAVTAQNSFRVDRLEPILPAMVTAQIEAVAAEYIPDAIKTGALIDAGIVNAVASAIARLGLPAPVVDPILIASSGAHLLDAAGEAALRSTLFPLAAVVTPNIPEAEAIARIALRDEAARREAAIAIHRMGPRAVVIKGGHPFTGTAPGAKTSDLYYDGKHFIVLEDDRVPGANMHGGGCVFSAAIAAYLARGETPEAAVRAAKRVIGRALRNRIRLGSGHDVPYRIEPD
jgi:hydroxymethylpyrimidine/phosphomethylpyrimidine kinase